MKRIFAAIVCIICVPIDPLKKEAFRIMAAVPRFLTLKINPVCGTWAEQKIKL
jgi:hypothetical protein